MPSNPPADFWHARNTHRIGDCSQFFFFIRSSLTFPSVLTRLTRHHDRRGVNCISAHPFIWSPDFPDQAACFILLFLPHRDGLPDLDGVEGSSIGRNLAEKALDAAIAKEDGAAVDRALAVLKAYDDMEKDSEWNFIWSILYNKESATRTLKRILWVKRYFINSVQERECKIVCSVQNSKRAQHNFVHLVHEGHSLSTVEREHYDLIQSGQKGKSAVPLDRFKSVLQRECDSILSIHFSAVQRVQHHLITSVCMKVWLSSFFCSRCVCKVRCLMHTLYTPTKPWRFLHWGACIKARLPWVH